MEFLNEIIFLSINYHMIFFIQKWTIVAVDSKSAWTLIACISVLVISNIIVMIIGGIQQLKHSLRLRKLKKTRTLIIEDHKDAMNQLQIHHYFLKSMPYKNQAVQPRIEALRDHVVNDTIDRFNALGKVDDVKEIFDTELLTQ